MKIEVTQKHIDDATASILYIDEHNDRCPIALAIYEQLYKESYTLVRRGHGHLGISTKYKTIRFGKNNYGNRCKVLKKIELDAFSLPEYYGKNHPPVNIDMNKKTIKFVIDFDKGNPVKPFTFVLKLPKQIGYGQR